MAIHKTGDMTDEQMEELLAQATTRLREKERMNPTEKQPQRFIFPKLDAGALEKLHTRTQHSTVGGIRKVDDPVVAKKIALEVRCITSLRVKPLQ
jgi:hypothetical protein